MDGVRCLFWYVLVRGGNFLISAALYTGYVGPACGGFWFLESRQARLMLVIMLAVGRLAVMLALPPCFAELSLGDRGACLSVCLFVFVCA